MRGVSYSIYDIDAANIDSGSGCAMVQIWGILISLSLGTPLGYTKKPAARNAVAVGDQKTVFICLGRVMQRQNAAEMYRIMSIAHNNFPDDVIVRNNLYYLQMLLGIQNRYD